MLSQSITLKLFKAVRDTFYKSAIYRLFIGFIGFISGVYQKSFLKKYIDLNPFFNKKWSKSLFATIFNMPALFISGIIVKAGKLIKKLTHGSFFGTLYIKASKKIKYHKSLALVFGVIFLIYSEWWNNMYAALAAVILLLFLVCKNKNTPLLPSKIDFFMVLFILSMLLGIVAANNKTDAIRIFMIALSALIFHLCTLTALNTDKKVTEFLKIISLMIALTAVVAVIQRIVGVEVDPEFVDLANNEGMPGRVFSTMENPNNYAELLVLFMPFMFALFVNETKLKLKVLWGATAVVSFLALAMTYSRSCYVAIAIATVVFLLVYNYKLILPVIILAIFAIPLLPETIFNRILTIGSLSDSSNSYRLYIWDACVNLIGNYGISGLGIGPEAFSRFYKPIAHTHAVKAPHSHMLYMELILEYGIIGFLGFMGYYIRIIRNGFRSVKLADSKQRAYLGAGIGALLGISFVCMAEYIWFYPRDMFAHFIVMGVLVAMVRNISKNRNGEI